MTVQAVRPPIRRGAGVLLVGLVLLLVVGRPALADGGPAGADVHVAQSLGGRELTVVLRQVQGVPGPLRVDVVTHAGSAPGQLRLRLAPTGSGAAPGAAGAGRAAGGTTVALGAAPGVHGGTLEVGRAGPQELLLDDGTHLASIPFVVPVTVLSPAERAAYTGFGAAGIALVVALVAAVAVRRPAVVTVAGVAVVVAVTVAVTGAQLSTSTPAPPVPGEDLDASAATVLDPYSVAHLTAAQASRPPVTLVVGSEPTGAGGVDLALSFTDSASGQPVDDLLVHDSAFVHLLVVSPSMTLLHLHPVRVAPGQYEVQLRGAESGHYALAAEVARRGGGVQQLRSPTGFDVPGPTVGPASEPAGAGVRDVGGTPVEVSVTGARAGEPTTVVARFGERADLQPWLGMVGHLIAVGPLPEDGAASPAAVERAPVWAHAHAMPPQASGTAAPLRPDESVAAFGPEVTFTHTFPLPGRYRVWVQAQRDYTLLTAPVRLDVAAPGGEPTAAPVQAGGR